MTKTYEEELREAQANESRVNTDLLKVQIRGARAEAKQTELQNRELEHGVNDSLASDFKSGHISITGLIDQSYGYAAAEAIRRYLRLNPKAKNVTLELNTPGGEIVPGLQLIDEINRIRNAYGVFITTRVVGQAASLGCVLAQASDWRQIGRNSFLMFHRAAFGSIGKTFEVEDEIETAKMFERQMVRILSERTGQEERFFYDLFEQRRDIWWSAEEALGRNLVDEVV